MVFAKRHGVQTLGHLRFSVDSASSALISARQRSDPAVVLRRPNIFPLYAHPGRFWSHRNARNSFPLDALLRMSGHAPGSGYHRALSEGTNHPTRLPMSPTSPFDATFTNLPVNTHSKALTPELNPFDTMSRRNQGTVRTSFSSFLTSRPLSSITPQPQIR